MKGDEVGSHPHQGRSERQKEKQNSGFGPFRFSRPGGQGQKERHDKKALEKNRGGGGSGSRCHERDDVPGLKRVEGKGGQHDPEAPTKTEQEPAENLLQDLEFLIGALMVMKLSLHLPKMERLKFRPSGIVLVVDFQPVKIRTNHQCQ